MSLISNVVTKLKAVIEAHMGNAVTFSNSAPVIPLPSISRQKWVEDQSNDPNIGEIKQLWELKKLGPRRHKGEL